MLEFRVSVDELDYGAVAAMLLPMVKERRRKTRQKAAR